MVWWQSAPQTSADICVRSSSIKQKRFRKSLVLLICFLLNAYFIPHSIGAENCTEKNDLYYSRLNFTNLKGIPYSFETLQRLTPGLSRAFLIDNTTKVQIFATYQGRTCIPTSYSTEQFAPSPYLTESEEGIRNFLGIIGDYPSGLGNAPTTSNDGRARALDLYKKLQLEMKDPNFSTIKLDYQSRADAPRISQLSNTSQGNFWQSPEETMRRRIKDYIESYYAKLKLVQNLNYESESSYLVTKFVNLEINWEDGCLTKYFQHRKTGTSMLTFSTRVFGPDWAVSYFFDSPYSSALRCSGIVTMGDMAFGKVTFLPNALAKTITITCVKGKSTKQVSGATPKCPTGYTKK